MIDYAAIAALGVATVHEAAGRVGIVDVPLIRVVPGSRVAGPARTALCEPGAAANGAGTLLSGAHRLTRNGALIRS